MSDQFCVPLSQLNENDCTNILNSIFLYNEIAKLIVFVHNFSSIKLWQNISSITTNCKSKFFKRYMYYSMRSDYWNTLNDNILTTVLKKKQMNIKLEMHVNF